LQNELSTDFEEATVEWVDCPDLTEEPFNLAAPGKRFNVSLQYSSCIEIQYTFIGLCGDTALFDIGGISNLFPLPKREKIFYFKTILQQLNRTKSDNFIIGGGLCERRNTDLGEVCFISALNLLFGFIVLFRKHDCFTAYYERVILASN